MISNRGAHASEMRLLAVALALALGGGCTPSRPARPAVPAETPPPASPTRDPRIAHPFSALWVEQATEVPIDGQPVTLTLRDGRRSPQVLTLIEVVYGRGVKKTNQRQRPYAYCHVLRPKDPAVDWEWSIWSFYPPLQGFTLVRCEGVAYLGWVWREAVVGFSRLDRPTTREDSWYGTGDLPLAEVRVNPLSLIGEKAFTVRSSWRVMSIRGLEKNRSGEFVVRVVGVDPDKVFTLVGDGTHWRVQRW